MGIDIGYEWFGISNGLFCLLTTELRPLIDVKNSFFFNIFRTNGCILIYIYEIRVGTISFYFLLIFNSICP